VQFSDEIGAQSKELQSLLYENLYKHYRVERMTQKAKRFIEELFNAYLADPKQLPPRYQKFANVGGADPTRSWTDGAYQNTEMPLRRSICDYIAGMTDRYAQEEYKKMFYPFERI
jgi:dGTPase